jgi:antitoxin (DNA-binding transcriptional repressor) of toxin-antitoxin stability system
MDITVAEFEHRCLEIVRRVERTGQTVAIIRRGKVVARLAPSGTSAAQQRKTWGALRTLGGRLLAAPRDSVLRDEDFEALRRAFCSTRTAGSGG